MNIREFQNQVSKQGLARSNRWIVRVYPPSGLTSTGRALSNLLSQGGNRVNVNLPGLDAADAAVDALNNLNIDLGPVNVSKNFGIPTLGYALTNMGGKLEALNLFAATATVPGRDINNVSFKEYGEERQLGLIHTHSDVQIQYYCSEDLREKLFFEQWQDLIFNPNNKQHGYYKDYISKVDIIKYNTDWSKQEVVYTLNEAYPSNVGELSLDQGDGSILQLAITFKFRNYSITG